MNRSKIVIDPALFPDEIRHFVANADIYDSSCSEAARGDYIDAQGGLFLK